ncbi:Receptor-like protein kinase [Quillaja saponaria]|uniref:Receptor-like protein kinase n=1 Tax=Quillaja saponaria TaxID=32244 RepID=A0AAD7PXQ0_QUISA|nr:Receptor-like protein kinase [Quillaja saponaria]
MEFLSRLLSCFSKRESERICYSRNTTNSSRKKHSSTLSERNLCRHFSLRELQLATKSFDQTSIIGIDCFGIVYKGCTNNGATEIAINRYKKEDYTRWLHTFKNEVQFLCQLHHPNLMSFIGFCDDQNELITVYEFVANGSLHDHLHRPNKAEPLSWRRRLEICIGTAHGLHYLHTGAKIVIIQRDMKTENILLDKNWMPKIASLNLYKKESDTDGMSKTKKLVGMNSRHVGTTGLIDPEYAVVGKLTEKTDVFAFGLVLLEVVTGKPTSRQILEENDIDRIMDPFLKEKTAPECWQT